MMKPRKNEGKTFLSLDLGSRDCTIMKLKDVPIKDEADLKAVFSMIKKKLL